MRTAGLTMNDVWAHRVLREQDVTIWSLEGIDAEIDVLADAVDLNHRGPEENYRPYLHVIGSLRRITTEEPLPYGLTGVDFSDVHGERIHAFYEFSDEQLEMLVRKGFFTPGFRVPQQIIDIEWPLPAKVDVLVLAPGRDETGLSPQDPPQVFTRVHDAGDLRIDVTSSDEVVRFFADHSFEGGQIEDLVDERGLRARSDAINSLFGEEEITHQGPTVTSLETESTTEMVEDEVAELLRRTREDVDADEVAYQLERERIAGTPENLYRERVALVEDQEPDHDEITIPVETAEPVVGGDLDLAPEPSPGRHRRPISIPFAPEEPDQDGPDHQPGE